MKPDLPVDPWTFQRSREPTILVSSAIFALAVAAVIFFPSWGSFLILVPLFTLWVLILYFFRDPDREPLNQPGLVVGPCDGEVVSIEKVREDRYLQADMIRISIFLSVFDVHVQRVPLGGKVTLVDHQPGQYLQAFRPEASEVNEYIAMQIDTPCGILLVKQIAGILARRCINYSRPGDRVKTGQRYGLIKFGSRVDFYLPPQADLKITHGDKVFGGLTPIAYLPVNHDEEG
jgi:phosphatidylserine decarboxylase